MSFRAVFLVDLSVTVCGLCVSVGARKLGCVSWLLGQRNRSVHIWNVAAGLPTIGPSTINDRYLLVQVQFSVTQSGETPEPQLRRSTRQG